MLPALPTSNSSHVHLDNNNSQRSSTKSSPSMIFRIEHLLPNAETMSRNTSTNNAHNIDDDLAMEAGSHATNARRPHEKRNGVYAAQFTPKDTVSERMNTLILMNVNMVQPHGHSTDESETRTYCTLAQHTLCMTPSLLRSIKLSEDIHSYNALFELSNGGVRVRIVRDIARDEELVGWFNEEITLLMAMPFLTPLNIQGNKRYTCHLCRLTFETPNPLKIHLALGCGHYSMDILWIRLHYSIKASQHTQHTQQLQQLQQLQPQLFAQHSMLLPTMLAPASPQHAASSTSSISPTSTPPLPAASTLPRTTTLSPQHQPQPTQQRLSAFKPISPSAQSAIPMVTLSSIVSSMPSSLHASMTATASTSTLSFLPSISSSAAGLHGPHMSLLQPPSSNPLNAAAQIEAIVSNMGTSKQGHLCIYCGKIYSRKYGLKIHIRTHTGFKPLKCKFCLRPFGDPSNLNKHVRLHLQSNAGSTGGMSEGYKCHLCQKTLARRRDLQRHIESRHSSQDSNLPSDKEPSTR